MEIVFDIETVGSDIGQLSESQQEFILRYADKETDETLREQKQEEAIRLLSLYPLTAKVIAIGMLNTETGNSYVLFEGKDEEWENEDKKVHYKSTNEAEMLRLFWEYIKKARKIITFNGRQFDIPFLMTRSAMLKVKPSVNFLKNRYDISHHVDLLEMFTYHGLVKKFNLDFYCRAFGVESPKSKGVTGMDVKQLYNAGLNKDIAVYCGSDIIATYELYKIWDEFLNI